MGLETLQSLLGWSLVVNVGFYFIWVVQMFAAREWLVRHHAKWSGIEPDRIRPILYQLLGLYKILILLFNFAPWLAVVITTNI